MKKRKLETKTSKIITVEILYGMLTFGNNELWNMIEEFEDPIMRLNYRKIFLSIGGKIPRKRIKNLTKGKQE